MSLTDLYISGGVQYMHAVSIPFIANLTLIIIIILQIIQKKNVNQKLIEIGKQLSGLALALGVFGTVAGLFQAFDALENSPEIIPFQVIMGGLKVALITALYGLLVFCVSQLTYIVLKLVVRKPTV
jgi:biopolymer transport protein ExbB/TolQ